ncbi:hypothetical protein J1N35_001383, partial [Gossypium stocksii]
SKADFDLMEGDVNTSIIDGVSAIAFSDRIKDILFKEMKMTVVAWIRLPDLLGYLYKRKIVEAIGGLIEKVVKLDVQTSNQTRGKFARLVVYINLDSPLISQILVDGIVQKVVYEALPIVCFACGKYGHVKETCSSVVADPIPARHHGEHSVRVDNPTTGNPNGEDAVSNSSGVDSGFGLWMLVERKSSRRGKKDFLAEDKAKQTNKNGNGSVFSPWTGCKSDVALGSPSGLVSTKALRDGNYNSMGRLPKDVMDKSLGKRILVSVDRSQNNEASLDFNINFSNSNPSGSEQEGAHFSIEAGSQGTSNSRSLSNSNADDCANIKFPRIFREYNMEYKPDIVSLLAPRVSGVKADGIIVKLGFQFSHRVEAIGFSRGIWIGWKDSIHLEVVRSHPQFILTLVWQIPSVHPILIAFVYGSPNKQMRQVLWNDLRSSIQYGQTPWMAIGDFNAILSSTEKSGGLSKGRICPYFSDFEDLSIRQKLECVLHHEEVLWKQKARLYREFPAPMGFLPPSGFSHFDPIDSNFLGKLVSNEEIKEALFAMAPLKAPGSDGFHALFFQKQWNTIGGAIYDWVRKVFDEKPIESNLNNTFIVLIPKIQNLEEFGHFRPISFCSVIYKLTMKKKKKWMAIKVDLEKAYDRVRWEFIDASLRAANLKHCKILKDILDRFCSFFGYKINARNTNIFFSKGVDESSAVTISTLLGFQRVNNLRYYLGVPLLHQRVTSSTLQFVVEKVRNPEFPTECPDHSIEAHSHGKHFYLNTDRAVQINSGFAATGGVVRNKEGNWVAGFHHYLGKCILGSSPTVSHSALIRQIHNILSQENQWTLKYIPREHNQVADGLAKQALVEKENLQVFDDPPEVITLFLKEINL